MAQADKGSGGSRLKTFFTSLPGTLTGLAALLTAIAAIAGVFLTHGGSEAAPTTSSTAAKEPEPQAHILLPRNGQAARHNTKVSIRYSHMGPNKDLWLVEHTDKFYPQPHCQGEQPTIERLPSQQSDTWNPPEGIDVDPGELLLVLTSKQESQLISEKIRGWCNKRPWPGIASLPGKVMDSVSISG
jgi:hypothetical protein